MADQKQNSENIKSQTFLEQENVYRNSLKEQRFEVELWEMRVKIISDLENEEVKKRNKLITEKENLQDEINKKKSTNCDFVRHLIENSWLSNLNNLKSLTQNKEFEKSQPFSTLVGNKLEKELSEMKLVLDGLHVQKRQLELLIEYAKNINIVEHSIAIWDDTISRIEKGTTKK